LAHRPRGGGPRREDDDGERGDRGRERRREHERPREERYDDPEEHHRVEKHRFAGGLPATPERYALAREQWNRLPGAIVRPSMDPGVGGAAPAPQSPEQTLPGRKGPEQ
jgi:hypothetical protein